MSTDTLINTQVRSLVGHIRQQQSQRLSKELDRARQISARLIGQAHKESRLAVHRTIRRGRDAIRETHLRTQAVLATRSRIQSQQQNQSMLEQAWPLLENAVQQRWLSTIHRGAWWREALEKSKQLLLDPNWVIEHPSDWPESEQLQAAKLATDLGIEQCTFQMKPGLIAGLLIRAGSACCDCTDRGLLHDRVKIESQLCNKLLRSDTAVSHKREID